MEDYKEIVFDAFRRTKSRSGHILYMRTFRMGVMRRMNPVEQQEFVDAVNSMIGEGLITYEPGDGGMDIIRLTENGYNKLYSCKPDYEIAEMLMNEFRMMNNKVGHIIPIRYFNFNFIPRLNPKEQDRFEDVVNVLIKNGFISYDDGKKDNQIEGLILQEAGYNYIYKSQPSNLRSLFL